MYADVVINDTLCGLYKSYIASYGHNVQKIIPIVKVGTTDQGKPPQNFSWLQIFVVSLLTFLFPLIIGNVSHELPAIHAMFVIPTENKAGPHSKGFAAAAGTEVAFKRSLVVGKTLAQVGFDVLTKPGLYEAVYADWLRNKDE